MKDRGYEGLPPDHEVAAGPSSAEFHLFPAAPFQPDVKRMNKERSEALKLAARNGAPEQEVETKGRTTLESAEAGFKILEEADLIYEGMMNDPALYRVKIDEENYEIRQGTYLSLAADCAPEHLGTTWPMGIMAYLTTIAGSQDKLKRMLADQQSAKPGA